MYINQTARYLGNALASQAPSAKRVTQLSPACVKKWATYQKTKGSAFPHVWQAFLAQNPICRRGVEVRYGYQPSSAPCNGAASGLLIDCWNSALQTGLTGIPLNQAQLSRASRHYRKMSPAQQIAGWSRTGYVFNGKRMVRNTLGQDGGGFIDPAQLDVTTMDTSVPLFDPSLPTAIDPGFTSGLGPLANQSAWSAPSSPLPSSWWNAPAVTSWLTPLANLSTTAASLITAAKGGPTSGVVLPNPALQTASMIPGVPNVILYGGAAVILLMLVMGRRR
jgi:hypothetical protein